MQSDVINVDHVVEQSRFGAFQFGLLLLCGLCLIIDGFDIQAMGYVAPAIIGDWHVNKASLGPVFGAGLFGMLLGSLVLTPVGDKYGRRPVLIVSTFFFAICMLLTTRVETIDELLVLRFITGFGLGSIMPNAMALVGEFSPNSKRVTRMMLVSCGFTVGAAVGELFRDGRAGVTLLLWLISFMNLINLYFLSNWLPTLIKDAGYSTGTAVLIGTSLQVGGIVGTLTLGWFINRFGFTKVLGSCFVVACVFIALIGHVATMPVLLFISVVVAGFCVVGGQPAVNALAGTFYPTQLRSTGIGWALGIGRIGSVLGPVIGGQLIAMQWANSSLFIAAAVPAIISALMVARLHWYRPQ